MSHRLCVFYLQSAALQKKLHHLEVQLNNEKQVRDEIEHKYRYRSLSSVFGGSLTLMLHDINYIFYTACKTNSCLCTNHHFNKICRGFLSLNKKKLLLKRKPVDPLSKSCVCCCFFTFCRGASSRLDKISKELEDEVRSSL